MGMKYEIVLTDTAKEHYRGLDARGRSSIKKGLKNHLTYEPMKLSRSRIKRLREIEHPEYRLRLDPYRVFYDVSGRTVVVLAIIPKNETGEWLEISGVKTP
uniref:mRNA-degrading endonuclease RelE, toxin component of the RelBE toxin-antitoxin system n=1 Tax=Candidatus Kentrum sp. TUN TaxID=2126343 RepID=A0A450Z9F9_9GAMM|nr:MAG: mRNA-degrading endonuclease RelE, toxin component of the RelBE toxin-antitoxin system [Candidatus Kentron sp. TUN]VFK51640.1 MAG: mRNA-degrading endonuclease RelE, toxin component of the RelBE toxin-antitoxin system [Candidatus Kentron sp. TUN]VFK55093.1 MAG: mRNA-degrading endonuclease RelE, toxin component of the RelBE toxin-antitoxin system [Candidatus Kentron sp. TUN]